MFRLDCRPSVDSVLQVDEFLSACPLPALSDSCKVSNFIAVVANCVLEFAVIILALYDLVPHLLHVGIAVGHAAVHGGYLCLRT